jgi:hypothetical protein
MTDLYPPVHSPARAPWYRRRGPQAGIVGIAATGLALAGLSLGSAASANVDPEQAFAEALDNLDELPTSITITGQEMPGEVTLTRTEDGASVSVSAPERGAAFDVALLDDRLYLRAQGEQVDALSGGPAALLSGLPSFNALLTGQWVSIDVSGDSQVLAALKDLGAGQIADPEALQAASDELRTALEAIAEDLRGPLTEAFDNSLSVTAAQTPADGPAGSEHYQVDLDEAAVAAALEPALADAMAQLLTAMDAFVAEVAPQVPGAAEDWAAKRQELQGSMEKGLAEDPKDMGGPVDVWIADGEFTQVSVDNLTLTFASDADVSAPAGAVSMDSDLLSVLPLLAGLKSSLGDLGEMGDLAELGDLGAFGDLAEFGDLAGLGNQG